MAKSPLTKSGKPRRRLVDIQTERERLKFELQTRVNELRALCTGKIPRLARSGSHQQAVEYKDVLAKACECWPNTKGYAATLKKKIERVSGFVEALKAFE